MSNTHRNNHNSRLQRGNSGPQHSGFHSFAASASQLVGSKWAFTIAVLLMLAWAMTGPYFGFSDTWQLVVNTATTVVTFLVVFLIQNTQNRDARAIHLKLDEIIRAIGRAHNEMINIEHLSDEELQELGEHFEKVRAECERRKSGRPATK
jgi:low affinity Fe/Cu permease